MNNAEHLTKFRIQLKVEVMSASNRIKIVRVLLNEYAAENLHELVTDRHGRLLNAEVPADMHVERLMEQYGFYLTGVVTN